MILRHFTCPKYFDESGQEICTTHNVLLKQHQPLQLDDDWEAKGAKKCDNCFSGKEVKCMTWLRAYRELTKEVKGVYHF
jgi:hypothetical protein